MRILFLCLTLIFAFSAIAQDDSGPISAVTSGQQDAEIANRIRDILDALGHSTDITVQVGDGVVTLRGTANSAPEIAQTENVATRVEGVVAVRNEVVETTEIARRLDPAVDRFRDRIDQLIAFFAAGINRDGDIRDCHDLGLCHCTSAATLGQVCTQRIHRRNLPSTSAAGVCPYWASAGA